MTFSPEAQTRMNEFKVKLYDSWRQSGLSGTEFLTVLLTAVREITSGYIIASDRSEKFQTVKSVEKEFDGFMKHVNSFSE